jgi:cyclic pyranopterin monophosphate synthase
MSGLSHLDDDGRARMVDVGDKPVQRRIARAEGRISLCPQGVALLRENRLQKGDALTVAQVAGIAAAKRTAELIPLCHPLGLDHVSVDLAVVDDGVTVTAEARCLGRTGVEMEALTAVSVALLAIYDMCKSVDRGMQIDGVRLVEKRKENPQT